MAAARERVLQAIARAIGQLNRTRPAGRRLGTAPETELLGEGGSVDSLGFVNLVVAIEEEIEEEFGVAVSIADAQARARTGHPFRTVGTLADYVTALVEARAHE
jgi:acyl carrier protein